MNRIARLGATAFVAGMIVAWPQMSRAQDDYEIVEFQSLTFPGKLYAPFMPPAETGTPVRVSGLLRLPAGARRAAAVIFAHGCAGLTGTDRAWAQRLTQLGLATFEVNSFSGRDIQSVCRGLQAINMASVLSDVFRALDLLAVHPRVDPARIAVMGFSFGGRAALWSAHPRFQQRYGTEGTRFAAHLALYTASCHIRLADEDQIGDAPIRLFHGTADDWTPIGPCRDYIGRLRAAGKDAAVFEYAGAHHAFDSTALPPSRKFANVANSSGCRFVERDGKIIDAAGQPAGVDSPCVTRDATIGHSPDAHRQAMADVENFLTTHFRLR